LIEADSLVVSTGGLSVAKSGATDFGYRLAKQFGLGIVPCRPALVPLTFDRTGLDRFQCLAGVSTEATVTAGGAAFQEKLLFTHRGLSGPAVLQASSYWTPGEALEIDLLPRTDFAQVLRQARAAGERAEVPAITARLLPKRLVERWFEVQAPLARQVPAAALSDREIQAVAGSLHAWRVNPAGTEGYAKAEVTAGGVDTAGLSSKSFEARQVPGLYFIGEVVDVTGQLGGFNFQWAWASGFAAGQFV
jgi:predicted Rossmann fold flavoprotein